MLNRNLHILFILILLPLVLSAQHIEMKQYTTSDGLPSNEVFHVMQDSSGYIWFCTDNGVSRFDGYEFENFDSSDGLAGSAILFSYEDYKGRIWFISVGSELSYYQNDSIYEFQWNEKLQQRFVSNPIPLKRGFFVDSTDCIYLSARLNGVFKIYPDGKIDNWSILSPKKNIVFDILNGEALITPIYKEKQSLKVIQKKGSEYVVRFPFKINKTGLAQIIKVDNQYLISTGFDVFGLHNENIKHIKSTGNKFIAEFTQDKKGRLWIGYRNHGIECYSSHKLKNLEKKYLNSVSVSTFLTDKHDGCWFTTLKNGVFYKPIQNIFSINDTSFISSSRINYARIDPSNNFILGTADNYLNILKNTFSNEPLNSSQFKLIGSFPDENTSVLLNSDYQYFGTERALFTSKKYDYTNIKRLKSIKNIVDKNKIKAKRICKIGKHSLSIGMATRYFFVKNAIPDKNNLIDTKELAKKRVSCLEYDSSNNCVWIGSIDGLYQHNLKSDSIISFSEKNHALSYHMTAIRKITNGRLAIGTKSAGLIIYDIVNNTSNIFDTDDGLSANSISSLVKYQNKLFAGTIKGINVLDIKNLQKPTLQIRKSDGLISDKINELHVHDSILLASTNNGLNYFTINNLIYDPSPLTVHIKNIKVPHQNILLDKEKKFTVSYPHNSVRFKYTPLTYNHSKDLTYKYRIKGDANWNTTTDNEVFFPSLKPDDYTFEIIARNKSGIWSENPAKVSFAVEGPYWTKQWFIALIVFLTVSIAGSIVYLIFRNYKLKSKAAQDITYYQQQALSNQMNPHFMFNSLNSVHRYLLEKNATQASKYLSKFARLMRLFLKNSQTQVITISKEIESIDLYLQLENLRMNNGFDYEINIDEKIKTKNTYIPSMLIQPLVENSIIHGIRYLDDRRGRISISIKKTNRHLEIAIEDNGVGRQMATEIEQKDREDSYGNSILLKRIELLNQLYGGNITLKYIDLYKENSNEGTRVLINNLPIKDCDAQNVDS